MYLETCWCSLRDFLNNQFENQNLRLSQGDIVIYIYVCVYIYIILVTYIHLCYLLIFFIVPEVEVKSLSHVRLFVTLSTVAHQAPVSMGFPKQESWSRLPFPSLLCLLHGRQTLYCLSHQGSPYYSWTTVIFISQPKHST